MLTSGVSVNYLPSDTLIFPIDSAVIAATGTLSPRYRPEMVKDMVINLSGKSALGKQELIILDMLQTNNWKRPMYYATTVSSTEYVGLDDYFQKDGMTYRIVPLKTREAEGDLISSMNVDVAYDNVMNKFKWGNINKPGIYIDETIMRMAKAYRWTLFCPLANALIAEGENEKALVVMDKCMEVLPPENVPMDVSAVYIPGYYFRLGQTEKAESIARQVADIAVNDMKYYFRLSKDKQMAISSTMRNNLIVLNQLIGDAKEYKSTCMDDYMPYLENFARGYQALGQ
jgi:tetratricopeptide (TPR) repeat protein